MGSWALDPRGPQAESIGFVYWVLFGCAAVVLAIVVGALTYSGIKFRDRPGRVAEQFHGQNTLELIWTVVPTIMVISFTALSWQRLNFINDVNTDAAMTIRVEGRQWAWAFTYPDQQMFKLKDGTTLQAGEQIDIPVGQKIKLELTAKDVIHSFWVPNLGGKKDAVPGHTTTMWLQADEPGTYKGQCTEYCGDGHADMLITVVAHPQSEYATWAAEAVKQADLLQDPKTTVGRQAFLTGACAGCHAVKGTTAVAKVGPDLTHIASKPNIAGVLSPVNQENLTKWVRNAPSIKPGIVMPKFEGVLPDDQIDAIVQWLLTLK
ncbi:MAG: cytochrome c oxidase subunit II [Chloroflexota bacterium]|nr:cytochrome c oxidase subunit II [Chloroflexota bacterium]